MKLIIIFGENCNKWNTLSFVSMGDFYAFNGQYYGDFEDLDGFQSVTPISDQKHNLIKATLNFAIKSRRKIMGLEEIQVFPRVDMNIKSYQPCNDGESEEKRLNRKERNRIAARKCRKNRKLKYMNLIEVRMQHFIC